EAELLGVRRACAWALERITGEPVPALKLPVTPREVWHGGWVLGPGGGPPEVLAADSQPGARGEFTGRASPGGPGEAVVAGADGRWQRGVDAGEAGDGRAGSRHGSGPPPVDSAVHLSGSADV